MVFFMILRKSSSLVFKCIVADEVYAIGIIFLCISFDVTIYCIAFYIVD
ncbi:hypothetical protein Plhal703r1_c06g0031381 [Plasmopara halstedii]